MNPTLLITDDDEDIRTQMKWALTADYEVALAEDRASALDIVRAKHPRVVLLDLGLPPHPGSPDEGFAALADILAHDPLAKVIIISGQAEKQNALEAIGKGAYDFLSKPVNMDELKVILRRSFHVANLERDYREMQQRLAPEMFEGMLGTSRAMQTVFERVRKVASSDAPVLLLGDSGTGKEMVAHAIHRRSPQRKGPFVAINCGAIPDTLLESELFGHERGAFTGAHTQRMGRIETAADGTLFLDEIGELTPALQVKLLRFLQEQTIERVGGRRPITVNARVVAATNVDLQKAMSEGKFREDLYYRLAVVVIQLPPLRERDDDALLMAQAFLQRLAGQQHKSPPKLDAEAVRAIRGHAWPGNVRELENRVKRAYIMAEGRHISAADLELAVAADAAPIMTLREAREAVERDLVQKSLRKHNGNISKAADELGISRPTLYELMDKVGIKRDSPRASGEEEPQ